MQGNIILKYIKKTASPLEVKQVELWINASSENTNKFHLIKAKYIADTFDATTKTVDIDLEYKKYHKVITKQRKDRRLKYIKIFVSSAAMIAGLGYFYLSNLSNSPTKTPKNSITLQLSDGSIKVIVDNKDTLIEDTYGNIIGQQRKNTLVYNTKESSKITTNQKLIYNTLTVPYTKTFALTLSDGTRVLLNSGSSIRYPVQFLKQESQRKIYLEGEAFFEVTKDSEHPFIVHMKGNQQIEVLGTSFNVSAYPEDEATQTVLIEGSVKLKGSTTETYLTPGYRAQWNTKSLHININKVDTSIYTAWTSGRIVFRHMSFASIAKKLERHYDVQITNKCSSLEKELFTASFNTETIQEVMESFSHHYGIKYQIIDNHKITILPKK